MLVGIALLFAFQGFSRAGDNHRSATITACNTLTNKEGRYFLGSDLKSCPDFGVSIAVSDVELDLRDHTIYGQGPSSSSGLINANVGTAGLSNLEIEGPGKLPGAGIGILFQNVHRSRADNLMVAGNSLGIVVAGTILLKGTSLGTVVRATDLRRFQTIAATISTDNEFRDNVVARQSADGVTVIDRATKTASSTTI
jgi:hypothetical protein